MQEIFPKGDAPLLSVYNPLPGKLVGKKGSQSNREAT